MAETKDCGLQLEKLFAYLHGEMEGKDCRELEEHLEECRKCAACREMLEKTMTLCRGKKTMPREMRNNLLEVIRKKLAEE